MMELKQTIKLKQQIQYYKNIINNNIIIIKQLKLTQKERRIMRIGVNRQNCISHHCKSRKCYQQCEENTRINISV